MFIHYKPALGLALAISQLVAPAAAHPPSAKDKKGAVASESAVCSHIGIDVLKDGGTAADAMVATVFCIGVVSMYHSGIGGGGFALARAPNDTYSFIDFRETAPAASFPEMYVNNTDGSTYGGKASGIPGQVRGLEHLHNTLGKLPWKRLVMPSVHLARNGFTITRDTVYYMESETASYDFLTLEPAWAIDFAPNGTRKGLGETLTRKRYADTLESIAEGGADVFHTGAIANATISALKRSNGIMTLKELADYTVALREPISIDYNGYKITSCSAPSGGPVALAALKIFEGYANQEAGDGVNLTTHRLDESMRFAYGMRTKLGDPIILPNITAYEKHMISSAAADEARAKISDGEAFGVEYYDPEGLESLETPGTSHIVTADASGMAISLTTTINLLFGSKLIVPETGVIMNNEMDDFSTPGSSNAFGYLPSPSNYPRPGARPVSSMSPSIATLGGHLHFLTGAAGGSRIITATIQALHHVLDRGLSAAAALAEPRLHDQLVPAVSSFEWAGTLHGDDGDGRGTRGFDNATVAFMEALGHNVTWVAPGGSAAQGIKRSPDGRFEAAGEPRQIASGGFSV